jgi:hypothetical protein
MIFSCWLEIYAQYFALVPYPSTALVFRSAESVKLRLTNNQPHSGLFSLDLPVLEGDTLDRLAVRLARLERGVKGKIL